MLKLMLKLGLLIPVALAIAATGVQIDTGDIDNEVLQFAASRWNSLAENLHEFVVDHDDEIIDMTKTLAGKASDSAVDAMAGAAEFAEDNKDEIKEVAEKTGKTFGEIISSDD